MGVKKSDLNGVLLVDKERGWTSHDVVAWVRRLLKVRKVGHTGTLDPIATGLLLLCLGKATKIARFLEDEDKEYIAEIRLGISTDTFDSEGKITHILDIKDIGVDAIESVCERFIGSLDQVPPAFSAIKVGGRHSYELARCGKHVELRPRKVRIYDMELLDYSAPFLRIRVYCSKGTYVRSLARDIGEDLGCGAHISNLRRTKIGAFGCGDALSIRKVEEIVERSKISDYIIDISSALSRYPILSLEDQSDIRSFCNGGSVGVSISQCDRIRVTDSEGEFIGIGGVTAEGELRPLRVICG